VVEVRGARRHLVYGWVGLGLAGSLALTAADSQLLAGKPIHWWLTVHLGSREFCHHVFWAGLLALCVAWLGLGLRPGRPVGRRLLLLAGGVWAVPLLLGPALFSGDMYSYLAQGDMLRLGINPYAHGPAALAGAHQAGVLKTVSPFWRHTPAPYGPLFVGLAAAIAAIASSHLVLAVLLLRVLELGGLALLAVYVPRLARALGADPDRAVWLVVISPLVLVEAIGGGHNDALMAGLLIAGVTYAIERRPVVAIVLCALAAAIKLPALAAIVLIAACWFRASDARARVLATTLAVTAGVFAVVGLVTTVGVSWISSGTLSTPGRAHLAITPATAAGYTLHSLIGSGPSAHTLESVIVGAAVAGTAVLGLVLLRRVRYERLALYLGVLLLASVLGGPVSWPWYLIWGTALVAVDPRSQRWPLLPVAIVVASFVIRPNGILMLPIDEAPYAFAVYAAVALAVVAVVVLRRRRDRQPVLRRDGVIRGPRAVEVLR
jgi:hypothetical protein